jgi:hypothetical protein
LNAEGPLSRLWACLNVSERRDEERSHKAGEREEDEEEEAENRRLQCGRRWCLGRRKKCPERAMHEAIAATTSATRLLAAHHWASRMAHQMAAPQPARLPRARSQWGRGAHCRLLSPGKRHKLPNLARFRNHVVQTLLAHPAEMNRSGDDACFSEDKHVAAVQDSKTPCVPLEILKMT